jgi:hypothetical protein
MVHMSTLVHVPPKNTFTPKVYKGRQSRILGMVSHVSHSVQISKEHIYTKGGPG